MPRLYKTSGKYIPETYHFDVKSFEEYQMKKNTVKVLRKMLSEYYSFKGNGSLDDPMFKDAGRIHDWRNYVLDEMKELWNDLSEESKLIIVIVAAKEADAEEWD